MRSIKKLQQNPMSAVTKKQSPLASISMQSNQSGKIRREKIITQCAFHPSEIITNFCKNQNCLLPLCPKCVKIHIQQHLQLGTAARFQSIDDCLEEAHQLILNTFGQAGKMQKISLRIEQDYCAKKEATIREFQRIKLIAFQYLTDIFKAYEQALLMHVSKEDKIFTENLIEYHDMMSTMMQTCRNSTKKFTSKTTIMQGLINFYSKCNLQQNLKTCEQKLSKLSVTKLQVSCHQQELSNIDAVIRRYVKIGDSSTNLETMILANKGGNENFVDDFESGNGRIGGGLEWRDFLGVKTRLDEFSIERSRNTRLVVDSRKGYIEELDRKYANL